MSITISIVYGGIKKGVRRGTSIASEQSRPEIEKNVWNRQLQRGRAAREDKISFCFGREDVKGWKVWLEGKSGWGWGVRLR